MARDVTSSAAAKDFPRNLITSLTKRGVRIVGSTWLPGPGGDFANGERGYLLDDNGTGRVRTYREVRKLAEEAFESIASEGRHRRELRELRKGKRGQRSHSTMKSTAIQIMETAQSQSAAKETLAGLARLDGYLGGRILPPSPAKPGWRVQAFLADDGAKDLPHGMRRVTILAGQRAALGIR